MKEKIMIKRSSTLFLRGTVLFIGAVILSICVFVLPPAILSGEAGDFLPILVGLYVPAVPFFFALYQTLKLLDYIDKNTAFSNASVRALKKIKYCAVTICLLFLAGAPYVYMTASNMDIPGVAGSPTLIAFASIVIAVFAAVLEELLRNAIAIKSENDLTV